MLDVALHAPYEGFAKFLVFDRRVRDLAQRNNRILVVVAIHGQLLPRRNLTGALASKKDQIETIRNP